MLMLACERRLKIWNEYGLKWRIFTWSKYEIEHSVLELIPFPSPHTETAIGKHIKNVLTDWKTEGPIVVTDNGRNIIKAFKRAKTAAEIEAERTARMEDINDTITVILADANEEDRDSDPELFEPLELGNIDETQSQVSQYSTH